MNRIVITLSIWYFLGSNFLLAQEWSLRHTLEYTGVPGSGTFGQHVAIDGTTAILAHTLALSNRESDENYVLDLLTGRHVSTLSTQGLTFDAAISENKAIIWRSVSQCLGCTSTGYVSALDIANGDVLWTWTAPPGKSLYVGNGSADGETVAAVSLQLSGVGVTNLQSHFLDLETGEERLQVQGGWEMSVSEGKAIRGLSETGSDFDVIDVETGDQLFYADWPTERVGNVAMDGNRGLVAVGFPTWSLSVVDINTGEPLFDLPLPTGEPSVSDIAVDGNFAIASFSSGPRRSYAINASIYDLTTGDVVFSFPELNSSAGESNVAIDGGMAMFSPTLCTPGYTGPNPCPSVDDRYTYVAHFSDSILGDLDNDSLVTASDIDLLSSVVREGGSDFFDLNADGKVSEQDREMWIDDIANTLSGDADLDGDVDFGDFLSLSSGFDQPGGWAQGDFDGSGNVEFSDFLSLSENFNQTSRITASAEAVPEPATSLIAWLATVVLLRWRAARSLIDST